MIMMNTINIDSELCPRGYNTTIYDKRFFIHGRQRVVDIGGERRRVSSMQARRYMNSGWLSFGPLWMEAPVSNVLRICEASF